MAVSVAALYFGLLGVSGTSTAANEDFVLPYEAPPVTSRSDPKMTDLARRLKDAGAAMYGAFWCSHCADQKIAFGKEAMDVLPYVECFPNGWRRGVELAPACKEANIGAFPTWIINGNKIEGELTVAEMEAALTTPPPAPATPAATP